MRQTLIFILWLSTLLWMNRSHGASIAVSFATSDLPGLLDKSQGHEKGFFVDLFDLIKTETGLDAQLRIYPWARAQKLVSSGDHHVLIGPYRSKQREKNLSFGSNPIYKDRIVLVTSAEDKVKWRGRLEDLANESVIIMRGWYYGEEIQNFLSDHKKTLSAGDLAQAQKLLLYGRGRYLIINERSYFYYKSKESYFDKSVLIYPNLTTVDGYIAYSKQYKNFEQIQKSVENVIQQITIDGRLDRLQKKYFSHLH
ncbi:ABC transporter, substrate-binding protein, family 3 [Bacteriovorax sp. BSW11_IV]|nr:ABC transporter, substrate-binding protein, family 3 [Bacteriovorax sp. BSW11_IV]